MLIPFITTGAAARPGLQDNAVSAVDPLCVMATAPPRMNSESNTLRMYSSRIIGLRSFRSMQVFQCDDVIDRKVGMGDEAQHGWYQVAQQSSFRRKRSPNRL